MAEHDHAVCATLSFFQEKSSAQRSLHAQRREKTGRDDPAGDELGIACASERKAAATMRGQVLEGFALPSEIVQVGGGDRGGPPLRISFSQKDQPLRLRKRERSEQCGVD